VAGPVLPQVPQGHHAARLRLRRQLLAVRVRTEVKHWQHHFFGCFANVSSVRVLEQEALRSPI
jgi:hypothetical protein